MLLSAQEGNPALPGTGFEDMIIELCEFELKGGKVTGTSAVPWIKLASWVYGLVMSIVKIHIICRTIPTLPYISTEGHIAFHLAVLQSVTLGFTILEHKKHQILH